MVLISLQSSPNLSYLVKVSQSRRGFRGVDEETIAEFTSVGEQKVKLLVLNCNSQVLGSDMIIKTLSSNYLYWK